MGCGSSAPAQNDSGNKPESKSEPEAAKSAPETKPEPVKEDKPAEKKDDAFLKESLDHHNALRAPHGASPMTIADDLVQYSQNWANDIAKRDTMEHSKCTLPGGGRVGENIYCYWSSDGSAAANGKDATQSWYDEIKDYNFDNPGFAMNTGHFTQVVWKGSTELGIAWAKAKGGTVYVVANYRPAGNMMGDFPNNVCPK